MDVGGRLTAETVAANNAAATAAWRAPQRGPQMQSIDEQTHSSDLSSAPSMSRQVTELSQAQCSDVISRQCGAFQSRGSEYWNRLTTAPAGPQHTACINNLKRQISAPSPAGFGRMETMEEDSISRQTSPLSRQTSTQSQGGGNLDLGIIEEAICTFVTECDFCVLVADPGSLDADSIAVSDSFCQMTGYQREEVIGENCRFLNEGCPMAPEVRSRIASAVEYGEPFNGVIVNRRKSGECFLNLLSLRGLVFARNIKAETDIWVIVGVQRDVTNIPRENVPTDQQLVLEQVARRIQKSLVRTLGELGLGGTLDGFKCSKGEGSWHLVPGVLWKPGEEKADAVQRSLRDIPDLDTLARQLPPLVGLSNRVTFDQPDEAVGDRDTLAEPGLCVAADGEEKTPSSASQCLQRWSHFTILGVLGAVAAVYFIRAHRRYH